MKDYHCAIASESEKNVPEGKVTAQLAEFFKVFGDDTRIRLLFALEKGECCVRDLSLILDMQQPAVSHQLKFLRQNRLVTQRKEGKKTFYALDDQHIYDILAVGMAHISEEREQS